MRRDSRRVTNFTLKRTHWAAELQRLPGRDARASSLPHAISSGMPRWLKRSAKLSRRGVLVNKWSSNSFGAFGGGRLQPYFFAPVAKDCAYRADETDVPAAAETGDIFASAEERKEWRKKGANLVQLVSFRGARGSLIGKS